MRTSSNLDVVDEEHAGRLVAVVSFYFRRNHAVCLVIRRMIFLWSSSSSQLSYYLVRLRATVVLAAGAHVPVARAPVVHVLMSFSIVPRGLTTTMWCLPIVSWLKLSSTQRSIQRSSNALAACLPRSRCFFLLALLPLHAGKWVRLAVLVLLDESASQRVMLLPGCFFFFESGFFFGSGSSSWANLNDVDLFAFRFVLRAAAQASFERRLCHRANSVKCK